MSESVDGRIPPSVLRWLMRMPENRPVAVLLRHAARGPLPADSVGYTVPITEVGVRLARDLGAVLGQRLQTLHSSPLDRCVQTAGALRVGAAVELPIVHDRTLGDPGVFVIDAQRAWSNWESLGNDGVMQHLVTSDEALPGMARPKPAARSLVHHMLSMAGDIMGVHVFVTHDSLVAATAAQLLGVPLPTDIWPRYLEGVFFWRDDDGIHVGYRDHYLCSATMNILEDP